jgi:K(+)-stimulated pyrophosphate-energized sodium pump
MKEKGTPLHHATVVGDTVGDPFKDTTSVALNPIIKFSTLFGLLAVEIAVSMSKVVDGVKSYQLAHHIIGAVLMVISMYFVWRSFYKMRIKRKSQLISHLDHKPPVSGDLHVID